MASNKYAILKLYKSILRESEKFTSYNYRMYAMRRARDSFKENKALSDGIAIDTAIREGRTALEIIKRQALISSLYKTDKLVIESKTS